MAKTSNEIYQEVTDSIVAALRQGVIPWERDFVCEGGLHRSFNTKKPYRGGNQFYLNLVAAAQGYKSPFWLTVNRVKKLGGTLKKINGPEEKGTGQKTSIVFLFKPIVKNEGTEDEEVFFFLKYDRVVNLDQVEGIEAPKLKPSDLTPHERADSIIQHMPKLPPIAHLDEDLLQGYDSATDSVTVHSPNYGEINGYYRTLFNYLVASTAHSSRVGRVIDDHGTHSKENLINAMGSAMLAGLCEIPMPSISRHQSYIDGWIDLFENHPRLVVQASSKAQRALDFIMPEEDEDVS
jgi:antirestriction protein ArdC